MIRKWCKSLCHQQKCHEPHSWLSQESSSDSRHNSFLSHTLESAISLGTQIMLSGSDFYIINGYESGPIVDKSLRVTTWWNKKGGCFGIGVFGQVTLLLWVLISLCLKYSLKHILWGCCETRGYTLRSPGAQWLRLWLWSQTTGDWIRALHLLLCNLGLQLLYFSVPQPPLLQDGDKDSTHLVDDCEDYLSGHVWWD